MVALGLDLSTLRFGELVFFRGHKLSDDVLGVNGGQHVTWSWGVLAFPACGYPSWVADPFEAVVVSKCNWAWFNEMGTPPKHRERVPILSDSLLKL